MKIEQAIYRLEPIRDELELHIENKNGGKR